MEIIKDADAIYQSEGKAGRLIFRKGSDIVVVEGPGSGQGNVITGYGPSGIKGDSGAAALGGAAGDGGAPVTDAMITSGTIPVPNLFVLHRPRSRRPSTTLRCSPSRLKDAVERTRFALDGDALALLTANRGRASFAWRALLE